MCEASAAADEPLPWPDKAYARVTETHDGGGQTIVMAYRVAYRREGENAELRFEGLDSLTIDGKPMPQEQLPFGPIFQGDLKLDMQGDVTGLVDRDHSTMFELERAKTFQEK